MKTHNESKAFKSDICLKVFDKKSNLIQHYRTHTGEKHFTCLVCEKKFALKHHLVRHQAAHSETRSFKCAICPEGRFLKTKEQLKIHKKFHFEPKFSCRHCDHKSYTSSDLNKHEKTNFKSKT